MANVPGMCGPIIVMVHNEPGQFCVQLILIDHCARGRSSIQGHLAGLVNVCGSLTTLGIVCILILSVSDICCLQPLLSVCECVRVCASVCQVQLFFSLF